jgi:hypothetical protein
VVPHVVGLPERFLHIQADAECPLAGGAQHDGVHFGIGLYRGPGILHLFTHLAVERIEYFGPVQRDRRHVVGRCLVADGAVGLAHRNSMLLAERFMAERIMAERRSFMSGAIVPSFETCRCYTLVRVEVSAT